jgi:hypothetical protein
MESIGQGLAGLPCLSLLFIEISMKMSGVLI